MMRASQTHIGYVRSENQDKVEIRAFGGKLLLLVCDGMGGERSGKKASALAADTFFEHFTEGYSKDLDALGVRTLLLSSVSAANSVVYTTSRMDFSDFGMGTTLVAAFVSPDYIAIVNVGDSRAYFFENNKMRQITRDHTVVNVLIETGQITEEEARVHPHRHILMRAVGVNRTVDADYFRIDLPENASFRLLLCSDGLSGYCTKQEIEEILAGSLSAEEIAAKLIEAALQKGGYDNVSVALAATS